MLLGAQASHAQIRKRCGLESFLLRDPISSIPCNAKKFLCPARRTGRHRFRLLPEAYLLTEAHKVRVSF